MNWPGACSRKKLPTFEYMDVRIMFMLSELAAAA